MNRIRALLKSLNLWILNLLQKIEESGTFERWVVRWESLDPRYQRRYKAYLNLSFYLVLAGLCVSPVYSVMRGRWDLNAYKELQTQIRNLALAPEIVKKSSPPPAGWVSYPVSNLEEFESSFETFLATLGIPLSSGDFKRDAQGVSFFYEDLTLRQIFSIVFQLDGWYPLLRFKTLRIENSKVNKVFLSLKVDLAFDSTKTNLFSLGGGANGSQMVNAVRNSEPRESARAGTDFGSRPSDSRFQEGSQNSEPFQMAPTFEDESTYTAPPFQSEDFPPPPAPGTVNDEGL